MTFSGCSAEWICCWINKQLNWAINHFVILKIFFSHDFFSNVFFYGCWCINLFYRSILYIVNWSRVQSGSSLHSRQTSSVWKSIDENAEFIDWNHHLQTSRLGTWFYFFHLFSINRVWLDDISLWRTTSQSAAYFIRNMQIWFNKKKRGKIKKNIQAQRFSMRWIHWDGTVPFLSRDILWFCCWFDWWLRWATKWSIYKAECAPYVRWIGITANR